jgi:hypothetical protein
MAEEEPPRPAQPAHDAGAAGPSGRKRSVLACSGTRASLLEPPSARVPTAPNLNCAGSVKAARARGSPSSRGGRRWRRGGYPTRSCGARCATRSAWQARPRSRPPRRTSGCCPASPAGWRRRAWSAPGSCSRRGAIAMPWTPRLPPWDVCRLMALGVLLRPGSAGCSARKSEDGHRARSAQRGGPLN